LNTHLSPTSTLSDFECAVYYFLEDCIPEEDETGGLPDDDADPTYYWSPGAPHSLWAVPRQLTSAIDFATDAVKRGLGANYWLGSEWQLWAPPAIYPRDVRILTADALPPYVEALAEGLYLKRLWDAYGEGAPLISRW
jgi:hypothetical protein